MKGLTLICCLSLLLIVSNSYAFDTVAPSDNSTSGTTGRSSAVSSSPIDAGFYASLGYGAVISSGSTFDNAAGNPVTNWTATPSGSVTNEAQYWNPGGNFNIELGTIFRPKANKDFFFVLATDYELMNVPASSKFGTGYSNYSYNLFNFLGVIKVGYYIPQTDFFGYLKGGLGLGLYDFEDSVSTASYGTNYDTWTGLGYTYGLGVGYGRVAQAFIELSAIGETGLTDDPSGTNTNYFTTYGFTKMGLSYMQLLFGVNFAVY